MKLFILRFSIIEQINICQISLIGITDNNNNDKKIELYLQQYRSDDISKGIDDVWDRFPATIDKITDWFKQYQVESIELWISGVMETGSITRLVVSAKGEGGMKIILKPKPAEPL